MSETFMIDIEVDGEWIPVEVPYGARSEDLSDLQVKASVQFQIECLVNCDWRHRITDEIRALPDREQLDALDALCKRLWEEQA